MSVARTRHVAELFRRVWGAGTGRGAPGRAELQTVLAISRLETSLAVGWSGAMAGSNNFGAVQCGRGAGVTYQCVPHGDRHADGTAYTTGFRYYVDAQGRSAEENGAIDFLKQISAPARPLTARALVTNQGAQQVAAAMRRERYYEGDARGGKDPVVGYTDAIMRNATIVAQELGEPLAVRRGSRRLLGLAALGATAVLLLNEF